MLAGLVKLSLIGLGLAIVAGGTLFLLYKCDHLVLDVIAPWAREHQYQGVLNLLVKVDKWAVNLRRIVVKCLGQKGIQPLRSPVLLTEQIMLEKDLPPELRGLGPHEYSLSIER